MMMMLLVMWLVVGTVAQMYECMSSFPTMESVSVVLVLVIFVVAAGIYAIGLKAARTKCKAV